MTETKNGAKYIDKDPPMEESSQSLRRKILDYLAYLKETLNFIFSNYGRRLTDANGNINELHRTAEETTSRLADTEGNVTQLTQRTEEIESTVSAIDTDMSGLQSQITQNATAIASKVSQTDYNGNTIASLINQTSTSVQIQASKVDLQGYVTFSNLSTSGQTSINGANITTGLIQDQAGKNSWNLNTGAFAITEGSINITTANDSDDIIKLNQQTSSVKHVTSEMTPSWLKNEYHYNNGTQDTTMGVLVKTNDSEPIIKAYRSIDRNPVGTKDHGDFWYSSELNHRFLRFRQAAQSYEESDATLRFSLSGADGYMNFYDANGTTSRFSLTTRAADESQNGLTFRNSSNNVTASYPASLTASRVLVTNASNAVAVSSVTSTELGYVSGVTSAIQTQLNGKQASISGAASTITSSNLTASRALISNSSGKVAVSAVTSTELGYVSGVTSAIQTQLNGKATIPTRVSGSTTFTPSTSYVNRASFTIPAGKYYTVSCKAWMNGGSGTYPTGVVLATSSTVGAWSVTAEDANGTNQYQKCVTHSGYAASAITYYIWAKANNANTTIGVSYDGFYF